MNARAEFDIGPLSWVKGEIDLALERASVELRTHAQTPADGAHLRAAQTLLHQAHGALAVVGLAGITEFSLAIERLLSAIEQGQVADVNAAGDSVQQGMGALRNYLDDLVNGGPNHPLSLFPIYRELLVARGVTETPASDLFFPDLTQRPPRREVESEALAPEAVLARWKMARLGFQRGLLKWIKSDASGLREMRNSTSLIEQTQLQPSARAPWWVALAVFDALVLDGVTVDASVKRVASRLDAQIKKLIEGSSTVSERMLRDMLYIVAVSTHNNEHIDNVRYAYRLAELMPQRAASADLEPARIHLRALREQITLASNHWDQFSAGLASALPSFHESTARLVALAETLKQVDLMRLVAAIANVANMLRKDPLAHTDSVAHEVATALLLAEEAIDPLEHQEGQADAEFTHLVDLMAGRLSALLRAETLAQPDSPELIAVALRARQRMLLHQVVKEIQANLALIEQSLDTFFRNPTKNDELAALEKPIAQIETALSAIGEQRAISVLAECATSITAFATPGYVAQPAAFEEVARKLSALGFFVEQLQAGATDIDAILAPARVSQAAAQKTERAMPHSTVESEMASRTEMTRTLTGALRNAPQDTALRGELKHNLQGLREDAQLIADAALEQRAGAALAALETAESAEHIELAMAPLTAPPAAVEHSAAAVRLATADTQQIDAELLEIFLEEAREVLAAIADEVSRLGVAHHAREPQSKLQRAFHTLKGSGHMVGLGAFASTAMEVEEVMNRWLQLEQPANPPLLVMLRQAHALFTAWVEQLKAGDMTPPDIAALIALCGQLQNGETPAIVSLPEPVAAAMVHVGALQLAQPLFKIFLDDTRSRLDVLRQQLPLCRQQAPQQDMLRSAHTLAGASATIGLVPLQELAHALEQALERFAVANAVTSSEQQSVIGRAIETLTDMADHFAGERMPERAADLGVALHALLPALAKADPPALRNLATPVPEEERRLSRFENDIDPQLLPLFLEESADLTAAIATALRNWRGAPDNVSHAEQLRRLLHTLKGSARMAGALAVGELAHHMETRIAQTVLAGPLKSSFLEELEASFDREVMMIETLRTLPPLSTESQPEPEAALQAEPAEPTVRALLRVRAEDLDQLVNEGSEIAVARSRIEGEMRVLRNSLRDMTDNVIRLRSQLREIEIQAETQIQSRQATHAEHQEQFDPLEMDRYTRLQELTRMMAESVNDVATVQHTLLRNIDHAETALAGQSRLNRDLSQRLMNLRMVPLVSIADRLYRVVRQTAKELNKRANLDIRGGQTELDRSVLEKMISPIEHLLRNAVAHGLENGAARQAAGKPEQGEIVFSVTQEGNEIVMELNDDGAGLDYPALRAKAEQLGLLAPGQVADEAHLTQLIFLPGFTTAAQLSAISGRGIGMDVVRTEAMALGGRIEVSSRPGQGTAFRIYLPVTLSIAPALLVKAGARSYAIPATVVEQAQELKPEAIAKVRIEGALQWQGASYRWHYLPRLLGDMDAVPETQHRYWLILIKGGMQRIAVEVDALVGNQEVVVKNIGPQLARVAGIAGATVLDDGDITLILNPVALASREPQYDTGITGVALGRGAAGSFGGVAPLTQTVIARKSLARTVSPPTVLVVDDSITVRKVASRQLERAGYRVLAAKDGIDALEQMQETIPDVMLADIEMPRMDGFDLARNVRADARLKHLPIIMITSRIADKHRNYAIEIGVNHYLGKPYDEQEMLRLVAGYIVRPG